jgi:hypothetical protein
LTICQWAQNVELVRRVCKIVKKWLLALPCLPVCLSPSVHPHGTT